jgi:protein-tyrosine-phosphatase
MATQLFGVWAGFLTAVLAFSPSNSTHAEEPQLFDEVAAFVEKCENEFDRISTQRKEQLEQMSDYLRECQESGKPARLIFVCTHNSRRSHMSQLWAAVAAVHYGLKNVETFSGGTECTAFNPRAVSAMERVGFKIKIVKPGSNPNYLTSFAHNTKPHTIFSKLYSDPENPTSNFCAVMTCSSADQSCPSVKGAVKRIAIPYEDPKIADDTPEETSAYDERVAQICREILYAFSHARQR